MTQKRVIKSSTGISKSNPQPQQVGSLRGGRKNRAVNKTRSWKSGDGNSSRTLSLQVKALQNTVRQLTAQLAKVKHGKVDNRRADDAQNNGRSPKSKHSLSQPGLKKQLNNPCPPEAGEELIGPWRIQKRKGKITHVSFLEHKTQPIESRQAVNVQIHRQPSDVSINSSRSNRSTQSRTSVVSLLSSDEEDVILATVRDEMAEPKPEQGNLQQLRQTVRDQQFKKQANRSNTRINAPIASPEISSTTPKQSIATGVITKQPLRKTPRADGVSLSATLLANKGKYNPEDPNLEKPIKKIEIHREDFFVPPKEAGLDLRPRNPKRSVLVSHRGKFLPVVEQPRPKSKFVDKELVGFLKYTFCLQPRTPTIMERMVAKAKQYLNDFDMSQMTHNEWHGIIVRCVETAMHVPKSEAIMRQRLQDFDNCTVRNAHATMVRTGALGRAPVKSWIPCLGGTKEVSLPAR